MNNGSYDKHNARRENQRDLVKEILNEEFNM